jgi:Lipase (class 3)
MSFNEKYFNGFEGTKAHELATLIGSAYAQFEQQGEGTWKIPEGYEKIKELKHDRKRQIFGFVALDRKNRQAFIIIRGTRTAYEWYNNTMIKHETLISINRNEILGITTKGFHSIYIDIRKEMEEALIKIEGTYDRLFVAGHSLGGALATLTILDLIELGIPPSSITVYTFASPRCADRVLAEDIVPTLPGATANILSPDKPATQDEADDENFIVRTYNDLKRKGMKSLVHTGTPIYFTIGKDSIEDNHNLEFVYMEGIHQSPASLKKNEKSS